MIEIREMWKRKRDKEEEKQVEEREGEEAFLKSRKVQRSPEEKREVEGGGLERLLREMREEVRKDLKEVKQQGREVKEDLGKLRGKMEEWEEKWRKEKEKMGNRMKKMEKRLEEVEREKEKINEIEERLRHMELGKEREEENGGKGRRGDRMDKRTGGEEWETRVKEMERKIEMKEREQKRKNIIIKGVGREGTEMEWAKAVLEVMGVQGRIERVKELGGRGGKREEVMLEVRMGSVEDKREIMKNKGKLRGRKEWIGDDLTWKERKMQWRLREIGEEEGRQGKRVRVSYGRIEIEGKMWFWDEQGRS